MKKFFILPMIFISITTFSQTYQLKLTNPEKEKSTFIKQGDKVVSSGGYLINSAWILKNGAKSMPVMNM